MIETKDKIRIQDLTIPEPVRPVRFFNPEDYLRSEEFDTVMNLVESKSSKINWLDDLFQIKIAAPEWYKKIEVTQPDLESLKREITSRRNPRDWQESEKLLAQALLVFPEQREYLMGKKSYGRELVEEIQYVRGNSRITFFDAFDQYFHLSVIYPEKTSEISFTSQEKAHLKVYSGIKYIQNHEPLNLRTTARARIMFPDEPALYSIDDENWVKIYQSLDERIGRINSFPRPGQVHKFILDLASVKILTAPEVRYTKEKGLELIYLNSDSLTNTSNPPESRKF